MRGLWTMGIPTRCPGAVLWAGPFGTLFSANEHERTGSLRPVRVINYRRMMEAARTCSLAPRVAHTLHFMYALNPSCTGALRHRPQGRVGGWGAYMKGDVCATRRRWSSIQPKSKISNRKFSVSRSARQFADDVSDKASGVAFPAGAARFWSAVAAATAFGLGLVSAVGKR